MDNRSYILDLLSRGAIAADVARTVGCSPAYISQLSGDPGFAQELAEKRAGILAERNTRAQKVQKIHDKYLDIEETLLHNLGNQARANLLKPIEQMKLLQVVAGKKEPGNSGQEALAQQNNTQVNITNISLPSMIAAKFVLNEKREIIGTEDGMSFAPMSGNSLKELSARVEQEKIQERVRELTHRAPENQIHQNQLHKTDEILALFGNADPEKLDLNL